MRRFILLGAALMSMINAFAQGPRVYRSEFITYDKREDAVNDNRSETARYVDFKPQPVSVAGGEARFVQKVTIDATMNDYNLFFHLENVGMAYTLFINNRFYFHTGFGQIISFSFDGTDKKIEYDGEYEKFEISGRPAASNETVQTRRFVPPASMTATLLPTGILPSVVKNDGIIASELLPPARPASISAAKDARSASKSIEERSKPCFFKKLLTMLYLVVLLLVNQITKKKLPNSKRPQTPRSRNIDPLG
mgnify:CR=1 FL=1